MSADVPLVAGFSEDEDDEWLYGEANPNDETNSSKQITGALAVSKVPHTFLLFMKKNFFVEYYFEIKFLNKKSSKIRPTMKLTMRACTQVNI